MSVFCVWVCCLWVISTFIRFLTMMYTGKKVENLIDWFILNLALGDRVSTYIRLVSKSQCKLRMTFNLGPSCLNLYRYEPPRLLCLVLGTDSMALCYSPAWKVKNLITQAHCAWGSVQNTWHTGILWLSHPCGEASISGDQRSVSDGKEPARG